MYIIGGIDTCIGNALRQEINDDQQSFGIPEDVLRHSSNVTFNLPTNPDNRDLVIVGAQLTGASLSNFFRAISQLQIKSFTYISSTEVYGNISKKNIAEDFNFDSENNWTIAEQEVKTFCKGRNIPLLIIRPALVIGNNPSGQTLALVKAISEGRYMHISDINPLCNCVLANDVAKVAIALNGDTGIYNITDYEDHAKQELINGIAKRVNNKRVLTLAPFAYKSLKCLARLVPSFRSFLQNRAVETTVSTEALQNRLPKFAPVNVIEYLNRPLS